VNALLAALVPNNALVTAVSRSFGASARQTEPWYGTRYNLQGLASERARWAAAKPAPGLDLPPPNPFLPRSLALKAPRAPPLPRGVSPPPPQERRKDERWQVLFRQDTEFGVPKAYACIELLTGYPRSSARAAVLARLYELLLADGLTEPLLYDARVAGLAFSLSTSARGVELFFGGFDDRLVDFVRASMAALTAFQPDADRARFEAQRDVFTRELESFSSQQPFQQASYWAGLVTVRPNYSVQELRTALKEVTIEEVSTFAERLWRREPLYGVALCQGNLRPEEVDRLVGAVEASLPFAPLAPAQWPAPAITQVPVRPTGAGCVQLRDAMDAAEENSAVQVSFEAGSGRVGDEEGRTKWASLQVLAAMLRDRFYTQLRTQQQLGYVVSCGADRREGAARFACIVQGAALGPVAVMQRIDAFLQGVRGELAALPEAEVRGIAAGLADARLQRVQQLAASVERSWLEVKSREFQWQRAELEAGALRRVAKADALGAFDRYVAEGGSERRRLVTLVFGAAHRSEKGGAAAAVEALGGEVMGDPKAFAAALPSWPALGA